jgi:hypothetical protein
MRYNLIVGMGLVAVIGLAGAAEADILTVKDITPAGDSPLVRDNNLRSDGGLADANHGIVADARLYTDVNYDPTKGPRHNQFWFDVSGIPAGATINSATFGVFFQRSGGPAVTGFKLSRFKPGKGWVEGTSNGTTALPGEPTWNSQKHQQTLWEVAGATGASDIDLGTTITFDKQGGISEWKTFDVTSWVVDWVNGVENNGMLIWGGVGDGVAGVYWINRMSEYADVNLRPYLTVDYVPEPVSAILLAAGSVLLLRRRRA